MKKFLPIALLLFFGLKMEAQQYPAEWARFTTTDYFYDIENGSNDKNLDEARFKNDLLDLARTNLSKQIQIRVTEMSNLDKNVVDGHTMIQFSSQSSFSTDLDLRLAETRSEYDPSTETQYAIAYINKVEACNFYKNELQRMISKVNNAIDIADNHISKGFKSKAKEELQHALPVFEQMEAPFFWLNIFGLPDYQIQQYVSQVNSSEQTVKAKLADLEHGTAYCVVCDADNFGTAYPKLQNEVKGELSKMGCNFVDDPTKADFVIRISASAREYNMLSTPAGSAYFSYVDAAIVIDKNATGQRVYEDEISVKGSHTLSYKEAGRDGYNKVSKEIIKMLKDNIEL